MDQFSNIAFISYKREDEKWAIWLQKRLESYKLPSIIRQERPNMPKYIRPVFRDKTDLGAGILKDEINKELLQSKYLIVICSPNSTNSDWINKEIQTFIDAGRSKFIIPFIIKGVPNSRAPENECFPKTLRALSTDEELLGLNINEIGKEQALVKTIARILEVKFDVLWDRHKRSRRIKQYFTTAFFALIILSSLFVFDYRRTMVEYYDGYVDCYGIPKGINPVNDISHRNGTFRFEYRRIPLGETGFYSWRLSKVKHVNSSGNIIDFNSDEHVNLYPSLEFVYTNNILTEIINKNVYDIPVIRYLLTNDSNGNKACIVDFENADKQEGSEYLNFLSGRMKSNNENINSKLKIKRYVYTRDNRGFITKVTYHSNNSEELDESAISDADGIFGKQFELDSLGRVIKEIYLNFNGDNIPNRFGVAQKTYLYDKKNNIIEETFLDINGKPTYNERKYAKSIMEYDQYDNPIKSTLLSPESKPCYTEDQISIMVQKFDNNGFCVEQSYFDINGKPCNCFLGFHKLNNKYDKKGNNTERTFFNIDGNRCLSSEIFGSKVVFIYDKNNRISEIECFGTDDKPCLNIEGFSSAIIEYDGLGNITEIDLFGLDGKRCVNTKYGWSKCKMTYNSKRQMTGLYYFDTQDNLCLGSNLFAYQLFKYDVRGNTIEVANYDPDGNLCVSGNIGAIIKWEYDDFGNIIDERYLDTNHKPMYINNIGGVCRYKFKYNKQGLVTERYCYDDKDSLYVNSNDWYAIYKFEYDERGNIIKDSYFDTDTIACYNKNGIYSTATYEYDEANNLIKARYFDTDSAPIMIDEAFSIVTYEYNDQKKLTDVRYFDTEGNPCYNKSGVHWVKYKYDDKGNEIESAYFDEYEKACSIRGLEHKLVKKYDDFNRIISMAFYDTNGLPVNSSENFSSLTYKYSTDGGFLTEEAYYDKNKKLISKNQEYACRTCYEYDDRGNIIKVDFYDENNQLTCKFGWATEERVYNERNQLIERCTYDEKHNFIGGYYGKPIERFEYNERNEQTLTHIYNDETDLFITIKVSYHKGQLANIQYLDKNGNQKVMLIKEIDANHPFACMKLEFYENGDVKSKSYYDENGNLYDSEAGYSVMKYQYENLGRKVIFTLFDHDGKPAINNVTNTHELINIKNEMGLFIEQSYYDKNGNRAVTPWGWARKLWTYDKKGVLKKVVQHNYVNGTWSIDVYEDNENALNAEQETVAPEKEQVTIMLSIESYGQMYEAGFRNNYHILEWNDWNMYQGIDSFTRALMKSKNTTKRLVLFSSDSGEVIEHTFSTESLNARIMDHTDPTGSLYRQLSDAYEKWKTEHQ